jgi:hypothetical protein
MLLLTGFWMHVWCLIKCLIGMFFLRVLWLTVTDVYTEV